MGVGAPSSLPPTIGDKFAIFRFEHYIRSRSVGLWQEYICSVVTVVSVSGHSHPARVDMFTSLPGEFPDMGSDVRLPCQ